MKYLSTQQWCTTNQSLSELFGVEYTPIPYDPSIMVDTKRTHAAMPWNKGKQGLQPSSRKGTKQGPMPDEQREKIRQSMLKADNSMHNPIHKAKHLDLLGKHWIVVDPQGTTYTIHGLSQFCKDHGLVYSNLLQRGKSKGWTCRMATAKR